MERKDWRKELRELSFMKGYYFKLEDNGLVEKKDDQLVFNREELERFVQQELDKAREEGRKEYARELLDDYYQPDSDSIEVDVSEIQEELSKLKTKEDGK